MTITDTTSATRTYAIGDASDEHVYVAASAGREWCGVTGFPPPAASYYRCSLPKGHEGPQHVAANQEAVVGVMDRDTSGDVPEPIVEEPTPEVLAERLRVVEEEVVRLRSLRDNLITERDRAYADRSALQATHDQLRQDVVDKAMELARQHDWCTVVQRGLEDMGLGDLLTQKYRVQVEVTATRTVTVEVEATNGSEAWRQVDNMSTSELADLIDNSPDGSAYSFYGSDAWEHSSHDAQTDTELVD